MPKKKRGAPTERDIIAELTVPHPRQVCYARIIAVVSREFEAYLRAHPDRAGDERNHDALICSTLGVGEILHILDDFEIGYLTPNGAPLKETE